MCVASASLEWYRRLSDQSHDESRLPRSAQRNRQASRLGPSGQPASVSATRGGGKARLRHVSRFARLVFAGATVMPCTVPGGERGAVRFGIREGSGWRGTAARQARAGGTERRRVLRGFRIKYD